MNQKKKGIFMSCLLVVCLISAIFTSTGSLKSVVAESVEPSVPVDSAVDLEEYDNIFYVDANSTDSSVYKTVDSAVAQLGDNDLIVIGEGTYRYSKVVLNKKINMIGQGENTELVFCPAFRVEAHQAPTTVEHTNSYYDISADSSFSKMCISMEGSKGNGNYFPVQDCTVTFNNVLFKDLYTGVYSVFIVLGQDGQFYFNNCTFSKTFEKLFRNKADWATNLWFVESYLNPVFNTSVPRLKDEAYVNINSKFFEGEPELDENYHITNTTINDSVGVYSGTYSWE